ncbi:DUF1772 domain-containing protein [Nocardia stercoris]|uniref:DUF1772 domain-containing protein n=2 Tax=Nocardia stercoris TaxID=2483361 RepID=A0A3M2LBF6_9NOCA|nr:DUF1772 domain-containing protein [Nocardia stercoris]
MHNAEQIGAAASPGFLPALRTFSLLAATLTAGLMAGLFAAFAYAVMPALARSNDAVYVEVMRNINVVIVNPLFMTLFMGGVGVGLAAVITTWRAPDPAARWWALAGFAAYLVMFMITVAANVPLNDQLAADPGQDPAAARAAFENSWVAWNIARAVVATGSLVAFGAALLYARPSK